MVNNLKIKKYWIATLCMVFCSLSSFAQELSDATIGFDVMRTTVSLREHGVKDKDIESGISMMRDMQKRQYLEIKKTENEVIQNLKLSVNASTNKSLAITEVSQSEKDALFALYNSTGGANWKNKTGWDFSTPVTSWEPTTQTGWFGITVINGTIQAINLQNNNLTGVIPQEIGQLVNLTILSLGTNKLAGIIPAEIGLLTKLNSLSISGNLLTGIPVELNQLSNLAYLYLNSNKLSGNFPNQILNLTKLNTLYLDMNQFSGNVPPQIGQLINLTFLNLNLNQFTGNIPTTISQLTKLTTLTMRNNQLDGSLPIQLGQLINLRELYFDVNNLSGSIPVELSQLVNLEILNLGTNKYLTGTIPYQLGQLSKLRYLILFNNHISGSIPKEIGLLSNLENLLLNNNLLTGSITKEIFNLPKLKLLYLDNNQLNGNIPNEIGQLTNVQEIQFQNNQLTGSIPSEIGLLSNLSKLLLSFNQLTGNIPNQMDNLSRLTALLIDNNQLEGVIPNLNIPSLRTFQFNNNKFRFVDFATQYSSFKSRLNFFQYAPQAKIDNEETINSLSGKQVTLTMVKDDRFTANDTYQWYKGVSPNGIAISGATTRQYTISNTATSNTGDYYCLSKHPQITDSYNGYMGAIRNLILERNPIHLIISNCPPTEGSITSTTDKFHTNAESSFAFESTATRLTYEWSVTPANGTATSNTLNSYTHTFTEAGDYEVKLVATDANGCSTTFTKTVKVEDRYCANEPVDFAFNTTESNLTYNWTSTDSLGRIVHRETNATGLYTFTPQVAGEYVIELVASSATSCKTLFSKNIIIDDCVPYISCTKDNPLSPEIHRLFINLIGKLASTPTGTDVNIYAHKEIAAVAPYTADLRAKIYNFTNTNEAVSFSFSATAAENEIYIPKSASGSITAINLEKYKDALTSTIVATSYTSGTINKSDGHVRNIDFCPKELSCVSHIALVVDESGSLDASEINKIKKQLKLFVAQQAFTNDDIGSNIHVSITGMSDSDANTRTDFIAPIKMTAGNVGMFNAWIDKLGKRYGETGVSQASDYWKSGLDGALAYTMKPTFVLMITDGAQTASVQGLKETLAKFDNNNKTVTVPKLPHLYVVGIENGNYVDRDSYTTKLSRDEDPNYNPTLATNNSLTAKTTPLLTKSLQYLLGLSSTEFPVSDINQFNIGTYYGHSNFDLLASDETYFADKVVTGHFACGVPAVKDFCDDCFSFKPEPGKEYILSAWVKEESVEQVKNFTNPLIKLVFYNNKEALDIEAQKIAELPIKATGDIIDGWQRVVQKFKIPTNTITIGIELENLSPSIPVYFDDIRIHPLQGSVKSFVYDPETFKLMSELDENNYSTFYEYDNEGGLVRVKKETAKGVKTIQETRSGNVISSTTTNP